MNTTKRVLFAITLGLLAASNFAEAQVVAQKKAYKADTLTKTWKKQALKSWLTHYQMKGFYAPFNSEQVVNVLDIDLNHPESNLVFFDSRPSDSLSSSVKKIPNAIAAVNGTYYEILRNKKFPADSVSSSFFKTDGKVQVDVTVPRGHRLFWKHEGAFYYDAKHEKSGIVYGHNELYHELHYSNVVSGSPMLIYNYNPVGETFAKPSNVPLNSLNYEDPARHQGVRHPRTAIAKTDNNHVLLITVDGRARQSAGMSAKELTEFIKTWFDPREALNLDGGGSTTMWLKDSKESSTGVINYPTDNKKHDHYGQRKIRSIIAIKDKK